MLEYIDRAMDLFFTDILFVLRWWVMFLLIGFVFLPLTTTILGNFSDKGYVFAKCLGILLVAYIVFVLGILRILPFTEATILFVLVLFAVLNILVASKTPGILRSLQSVWKIILFEEVLFLAGLSFWSFIRANQPDIHGLEKYMDFGFINSILRSNYFPPADMWFTPLPINYYYFGHLVTAVLTKLTMIPSNVTFNLMLATIFGVTLTGSFCLGFNLFQAFRKTSLSLFVGLIAATLVTLAGNPHSIYTFFMPYNTNNPVPIWQLPFSPTSFPNGYWYPNATRFIANTIHEFPLYSFVVSDLHGHVLDIPLVLFTLAFLLHAFLSQTLTLPKTLFASFLIASMYMTNAWDGMIYLILASIIFVVIRARQMGTIRRIVSRNLFLHVLLLIGGFALFSFPFSFFFKPLKIASGIGILCAPEFLTNLGKLGPFLFEADHCQRSPWWQLLTLHGFFLFSVLLLTVYLVRVRKNSHADIFALILIILSVGLIIIPEFMYLKDIYPAHYRANTMFKLVYQSFIMLSLVSAYAIGRVLTKGMFPFRIINAVLLFFIGMYPFLAIKGYYGSLTTYRGLDGTSYLKASYPSDYEAILWINKTINQQPVILEAQGDSYTDYARVSANTGLPTVLGWTVHEWLWRGTYDVPSPRISEVQTLYETTDENTAKKLIRKYNISYVFIGSLEREKYAKLTEGLFQKLGSVVYHNDQTRIYKVFE